MKVKVLKPTEVDIKYLDVFFGGRFYPEDLEINDDYFEELDEVFDKYPSLKGINPDGYEDVWLRIDVDTGTIVNWPKNCTKDCYMQNVKIVDEGIYILTDSKGNCLHTYRGYVPSVLEIDDHGYGDYFQFTVQTGGKIKDWKFSQEDFNEFNNN